jgi:hypothetical protein
LEWEDSKRDREGGRSRETRKKSRLLIEGAAGAPVATFAQGSFSLPRLFTDRSTQPTPPIITSRRQANTNQQPDPSDMLKQ